MSKFNHYAKELDQTVKASFEVYRKAKRDLEDAIEYQRKHPDDPYASPEEKVAAARARASYLVAEDNFKKTQKSFGEEGARAIGKLREGLALAIDHEFAVDPAQIDHNAMELLKSGIMSAGEYKKLADDAESRNNYTMSRMIGKYAQDAADRISKEYGESDREATILRNVANQSRRNTGRGMLDVFDSMSRAYNRCTNNPALMEKWDDLFSDIVEDF